MDAQATLKLQAMQRRWFEPKEGQGEPHLVTHQSLWGCYSNRPLYENRAL